MKLGQSIAFLFIGGPHQIFHAAPVAAEMARAQPSARITMLCADRRQQSLIRRVLAIYGADTIDVVRLKLPRWVRFILRTIGQSASKIPLLFSFRRLLDRFDAIIVPERTSAHLKTMGVSHPKLIHFRHGAGDRAPSSERRMNAFDLVAVPGDKDARRAIDSGLIDADRVAVIGYVKFDLIGRMTHGRPRLFSNGRPTVLYNPHFAPDQSSWYRDARAVIEAFRAQDRYNLIVAPHIRLFDDATAGDRAAWEALAVPGKIIVDLGSDRSIDMTYTMAADLYLGDVSSQVYEFIVRPRPAVFIDTHGVDWSQDPKYACWHLGEVINDPREILPAVERAFANPLARATAQRLALTDAVGNDFDGAAARGASAVLSYLDRAAA